MARACRVCGGRRAACEPQRGAGGRRDRCAKIAQLVALGLAGVALTSCASAVARVSTGLMRPVYVSHRPTEITHGQLRCQKFSVKYHCYLPREIRRAYAIKPLLDHGWDGAGMTIAIIDAFQNPTMASDLAHFDAISGLRAPPHFRTIAPFGLTPFNPKSANQVGWSGEIALDVEWAHAVAPAANIDLYLGRGSSDADLARVEEYVISHHAADVISMSYVDAEQCMAAKVQRREHAAFEAANDEGITLVAGAGDWGAAQYECHGNKFMKAVGVPAADPLVTGVGGTTLHAGLHTGAYHNEVVWNEGTSNGAGGGGFSSLYSRPQYQAHIDAPGSRRGVPDVSYNASAYWGVYVAWGSSGQPGGRNWSFYGTSCGAPQWAGIVAIADQRAGHTLGNIDPALYRANEGADFHDITVGDNSFAGISGYQAGPGWDAASGLGSPIVDRLVRMLSAASRTSGQTVTPPTLAPIGPRTGGIAHPLAPLSP